MNISTFKTYVKLLLKIFLSIALLYIISQSFDLKTAFERLQTIEPLYFFLAVGVTFIASIFMVLKFRSFIQKISEVSFFKLSLIYWAGDFLSLMSFGAIASEIYKTISFHNKKLALLMSMTDRAYAFVWMLLFFTASIFGMNLKLSASVTVAFIAAFYFVLVVSAITVNRLMRKWFVNFEIGTKNKFLQWLIEENEVADNFLFKHALFTAFHLVAVYVAYSTILLSLGVPINIGLIIYIPLITILLALPISVQGLGVRELVLLQYASTFSLDASVVLTASLGIFFVGVAYRLLGLIPFMLLNRKH